MTPQTISVPTLDLDAARRFIAALTGEVDTPVTFQTLADGDVNKAKRGLARILHGTLSQHAEELRRLNERGAAICVTVNKTDGRGRKADNVLGVRAFFLDCDNADAASGKKPHLRVVPLDRIKQFEPPPHVIVESSPGNYHVYWLVADCPTEEFATIQAALARTYGSDDKVKDLPRPMRVPGFLHRKGEPFRTQLVSALDNPPFTLAEIRAGLLPNELGTPTRNSVVDQHGSSAITCDGVPGRLDLSALMQGVGEGARDASIFKLACSLRARHFQYEEARNLVLSAAANCTPPFPEVEALRKLEQAWKYPEGNALASLNDVANAKRLVSRHGADLRWIVEFQKWVLWKGDHWQIDIADEVMARAKTTASSIYAEAALNDMSIAKAIAGHAAKSQQLARLRAMIELAKSETGMSLSQAILDADPWLLGVQNGVIDLRTGGLRAAAPEDFITKRATIGYDAAAACPLWKAFIERITGGDHELAAFIQRAVGYSLTGSTEEQVLFFLYGIGRNGKSTFLGVLKDLLGEYAAQCEPDTLMVRNHKASANNDIARLRGSRFVSTIEAEEGKRLAEALVKQLTGGDMLVARFLFQEYFEFRPQFKIWLAANHKPIIRGDDFAIWRRIRLIPFTVTIPDGEVDRRLPDRLAAERLGILRWAVEGCLAWQREGLNPPTSVLQATDAYKTEMDVFGAWLNDCCDCGPLHEESAKELYESYRKWCEETESYTLSQMKFALKLQERQFRREHTRYGAVYHGVALRRDKM